MVAKKILILAVAIQLVLGAVEREVIINEDDLMGTCTRTCGEVPTIYGKFKDDPLKCNTVKDCKFNSAGWDEGFVRCDYCKCTCVTDDPPGQVKLFEEPISVNEPDIYGTCTGTCWGSGLVRIHFKGCQELRDCQWSQNGWLRGFVRCDYCSCTCRNYKFPHSYKLKNVYYNMDELAIKHDKPQSISQSIIENCSNREQTVLKTVQYDKSTTVSMDTTEELSIGTTLTVEASFGFDKNSVTTSVAQSIGAGWTTGVGSANTSTVTESQQAQAVVGANEQLVVKIIGHNMFINIPYTADLETTYKDGSTDIKRTSGIFTGVDSTQFRVQYGEYQPHGPESCKDPESITYLDE